MNKSICIKLQNYYNATILFVTCLAIFKNVSLLIDQSPLILMRFLICFSQKSSFLSKKRQDYIPDAFNITDINLSCNIWNLNRPNNSFTFIRRYFSRKSIFSCLWPSALISIPLIFIFPITTVDFNYLFFSEKNPSSDFLLNCYSWTKNARYPVVFFFFFR